MSTGSLRGHLVSEPRWGRRVIGGLGVVVVLLVVFAIVQLLVRPVPALSASTVLPTTVRLGGRPPRLPWPAQGSAAVEVIGGGSFGSVRGDRVTPLASLTKLITALVVLKRHPLGAGASGPVIPVSAADVAAYKADLASGQSVLAVSAREHLSEHEALEGLLVPAGNNIALILAQWDAGSTAAFVARMNAVATSLGLKHTHFVDPSGLAPGNTGTAIDMMRLGADALANHTIASIVDLSQVNLPVAGTVLNYDYDVGHHGIIGIKTGSSDAAGGTFVFAAQRTMDGEPVTVVGAVLKQEGASRLQTALNVGERLADAALQSVRRFTVLHTETTAIRVQAQWSSAAVLGQTAGTVRYLGIPGTVATLRTVLSAALSHGHPHQLHRGERLATVTVKVGTHTYTVPVIASSSLPGPTLRYRLTQL